jgi:hypothetical protein
LLEQIEEFEAGMDKMWICFYANPNQ